MSRKVQIYFISYFNEYTREDYLFSITNRIFDTLDKSPPLELSFYRQEQSSIEINCTLVINYEKQFLHRKI